MTQDEQDDVVRQVMAESKDWWRNRYPHVTAEEREEAMDALDIAIMETHAILKGYGLKD